MADWTAITGIVVSGAVGPSVIAYWTARQQRQREVHEVTLADRAAARTLLDDTVAAVREAEGLAWAVHSATISWGHKLGGEGGVEQVTSFRAAARRVDLMNPRVHVMFGQGEPVALALADCVTALEKVAQNSHMISAVGSHTDFRPYYEDLKLGCEELGAAHGRLLDAAHQAVGVRSAAASRSTTAR